MYVKGFEDKKHSTLTIAVSFTLNQSMSCYLTFMLCVSAIHTSYLKIKTLEMLVCCQHRKNGVVILCFTPDFS